MSRSPVPLLLVGPQAVDDADQNDRIRALDAPLEEEAAALDIPFVPAFAATKAADAWRRPVCEGDGFHPDAAAPRVAVNTTGGGAYRRAE